MQGIQIGSHGAVTPQSQAQQDSLYVVNNVLLNKYNGLNSLVSGTSKITSEMFDGGLGVLDFKNTGDFLFTYDGTPILLVTRIHAEKGSDASRKWFHKNYWYENTRDRKNPHFTHITFISSNNDDVYEDLIRNFHMVVNNFKNNIGFNISRYGTNSIYTKNGDFDVDQIERIIEKALVDLITVAEAKNIIESQNDRFKD
jgi:hypothetical protein